MEDMIERAIRQGITELGTESEIIDTVVGIAGGIFEDCTADRNDFGIQHVSVGDCIIFGGTNRLKLRRHGWQIFPSHCSSTFTDKFNAKFNPLTRNQE